MSVTRRDMKCRPEQVFAVLEDGWLMGLWVVGASRIRDVPANWPAVGSKVDHSVGTWPLLIDDSTSVESVVKDRSLRLRARAWPAGEADVHIEIDSRPDGCRVTISEDVVKGPGLMIPKLLRSALLNWRNGESLRRLAFLAERRSPAI
ncbi:MAG: SRPBCC family protein [Actinomycetota bacterium]|nr:SRPBCC family protein [Actinomycetota bacterium]